MGPAERALGSACSQSPETVSCSPRVQSFPAAQPGKPLAESVAGQRTTVAPGEDGAGINHEDLGLLEGSSFMFMSTQCPPGLSVGKAVLRGGHWGGERSVPRCSRLEAYCAFPAQTPRDWLFW
ncbi:hypothetical protein DV515_00014332 [Chloebia gouldiae]|uniref:Uncharacterized protein n=1 Tax=Chloebia gouldiae TaxID=44316 RepID=A0A3L8RYV5_CHLGU|nr:hypothetical protein DV515_00014363 [Chloebia gouldiae]RLV90741.1 hypothetical protein DV515_00014332 [Chloebia gouldiae]